VSTSSVPVGAITGGAIGGAALLLLSLIFLFIALRWRSRQARETFTMDNSDGDHPAPQAEDVLPQVEDDLPLAEDGLPPPEYQHVFPALRAISLRALAPAWAGGSPRRKRGRVAGHPGSAAQPSTHPGNVANLPCVEIPRRVSTEDEVRPSRLSSPTFR
jgi:hypothetical protein